MSPAIEWLHDGSLPSQGSGEEENLLFRQEGGTLANSGFLRRQEPMSPATEWLHDGALPSQGSSKRKTYCFAKAM